MAHCQVLHGLLNYGWGQAEREGEADLVSRELDRLWAALDMPGVDVDRAALTSLLEGPWRLHPVSIEKVSTTFLPSPALYAHNADIHS